jgi:hypothetical protein
MDDSLRTITNGVKLVGEAILPGTSLLMDGKFAEGAGHVVVGVGARIVLGPIGALVVAADSFSKSVADKNLWNYAPPLPSLSNDPVAESAGAKAPAKASVG